MTTANRQRARRRLGAGAGRRARPGASLAGLAALAALLAGCGGPSAQRPATVAPERETTTADAAAHVHGLGVDPADGSLLVATHHGLLRAPEGSPRLARVGESDRDLMGFSVVGARHYLASGHPGSEPGAPNPIGLARSRDGGRSWRTVSLEGSADFHVLRASGRRVYGYDGHAGALKVSSDGGRSWTDRAVPAPPLDLAIDPSDRDRLVATTEGGLLGSSDGGRSWRSLSDHVALLAWPERGRLVLVEPAGRVLVSADAGRSARPRGAVDGAPVALAAAGDELLVALADGTIVASEDGGASFSPRARP